jgi:heparosan-N-sulfate-glucuronate 5-epimerase
VKGLSLSAKKTSKKDKFRPNITRMRLLEVVLHGHGYLDDVVVASTAHSELFHQAAQWLVRHQDNSGGWPISVKRKLGDAELQPGWYSAMAQGQAMSTLTRAYRRSGEIEYLEASVRALDLFKKSAAEGGIAAGTQKRKNKSLTQNQSINRRGEQTIHGLINQSINQSMLDSNEKLKKKFP